MITSLMPVPKQQYFAIAGIPLVGGKVYTFAAGTTTPKATYTDAAGTTPQPNPIPLNARGEPASAIYWAGNYRVDVRDALGNLIYSVDNYNTDPAGLWTLSGNSGASMIGFLPAGTGAAPRTLQEKLRESISTLDFITDPAERQAIMAGTSTVDHTTEIQKAIDFAGSTYRLHWIGAVNTGSLQSAESVDWFFEGGAKVKQIPATYTASHVVLSGPRIRLEKATFDGNQAAMQTGQGSNGLEVSGVSPTLVEVSIRNYNGVNYTNSSANVGQRRGLHIGCSFDDGAGLGMNMLTASYHNFLGCTFDRNGYGFQKSRANYADVSHGFVAFGVAVRLRSHHINFESCTARDNGRDGFNVNQGSYAIKFAQCLAHGNDDGGFTIASDNTGSSQPGELEPCYDIEYVDCESYNNYTSGLAAYQLCHNVTVLGGRYYNNHRLAGNQSVATSYYNGIFFAGGSTGINVDTKCYDDRQFLPISAISAGALTVPGWVPGAMTVYPKVAIYGGADQGFKGYAKITAEASGSVTITATSFNAVNLANIVVGDYVTQAVQHCGLLTDNTCNGAVAIDGYGHHSGPSGASGRNVYSGSFTGGQNILLPKERLSAKELMVNGSFDTDLSGWTFNTPGGGTATYINTGTFRRSGGALKMTAGTAEVIGDNSLVTDSTQYLAGEFAEAGIWCYASARDDARFLLFWTFDGASFISTAVQHPGGGWRYMKVGAYLPGNITGCFVRVACEPGKTVYFDDGSLRSVQSHMDPREFAHATRGLPY